MAPRTIRQLLPPGLTGRDGADGSHDLNFAVPPESVVFGGELVALAPTLRLSVHDPVARGGHSKPLTKARYVPQTAAELGWLLDKVASRCDPV